jgi:lysozyme family protein
MTSDEKFKHAISIVSRQEGGLVNDEDDKGGITNLGISLRWLKSVGESIDDDEDVDADDIRALTHKKAHELYRKYWWDKYRYNELKDLQIATKMFSLSVNMGPTRAHKILQQSINRLNSRAITIDGLIGGITIGAANKITPYILLEEIRLNAAHFYLNLAWDNEDYRKYLLGWMKRAFS